MLYTLIEVVFSLGLTLGVGSSTFALIFYIKSLQDGVIDATERSFLHTVFFVLRIGMVLIAAGLGGKFLMGTMGEPIAYGLSSALIGIIALNAILMDRRIMPMQYGPILAGGSWYSLFFVSKVPVASFPLWVPVVEYVVFLIVFYFAFHFLRKKLSITPSSQQR